MGISEKTSTGRTSTAKRARSIMCLVVASVCAVTLPDPSAAQPVENACGSYWRIALTGQRASALRVENGPACPAIATGNAYQVLDWLENGEVDAAVMSPFAAALVRYHQGSNGSDVFGFATELPFSNTELPTYRVGIEFRLGGTLSTDPEGDIGELLGRLGDPDANGIVRADSYLDAGLRALLDYIEIQAGQSADSEAMLQRLLDTIQLGRAAEDAETGGFDFDIRLRTIDPRATPSAAFLDLTAGEVISDVFVYKRSVFDDFSPAPFAPVAGPGTVGGWLRDPDSTADGVKAIHGFMQENYSVVDIGARQHRHFRYTLPELFRLLDDDGASSRGNSRFGLILTGGGVKAAWQTRVVQELYGRWLTNLEQSAGAANGGADPLILVDHVVGTSGGALLGIFVSSLGNEVPELTDTLWRVGNESSATTQTDSSPGNEEPGRYLESYDVFPWLEMPRYLSAVLSLTIFSIVSILFYAAVKVSRKLWPSVESKAVLENVYSDSTMPAKYLDPEPPSGITRPGTLWVILLVVSPWLIKIRIDNFLEHVPAIAGLAFMVYAMIAIYNDNRVIFDKRFEWKSVDFKPLEVLWLAGGMIAIFFLPRYLESRTVFEPGALDAMFGREIEWSMIAICLGLMAIFLVVHRVVSRRRDEISLVDRKRIIAATAVLLLIVAAPQAALYVFGIATNELTVEFWRYLVVFSLSASMLMLVVGHLPRWERARNPIRAGLDFLRAPFPRSTYLLKFSRMARITLFFFMAFAYWNLVMAPAIYGNERATNHFVNMYVGFFCGIDGGEDACRERLGQQRKWTPQTEFVIAATSLEEQRERYFVFDPNALNAGPEGCAEDNARVSTRLAEIAALDRRWTTVGCDVSDLQVIEIAFSSGSPFPVFPANQVEIAGISERLVDGGYAHNMPIEAAVSLGAGRALVISSSPLHLHETDEIGSTTWTTGFLFHNLQRLFPYLFNRSQVEDLLSAQDSIVATISPVYDPEEGWPILTDFSADTIEWMIDAAAQHVQKRIGMVESWGSPACTVRGSRFSCSELARPL